ncbi:MAG: ribonuclease domain-containing protein [Bacillota bacterium]|nr:ribonuclease domain-containing protein [Bacillota bacterium]
MKKIFSLFLILFILFSFTACSVTPSEEDILSSLEEWEALLEELPENALGEETDIFSIEDIFSSDEDESAAGAAGLPDFDGYYYDLENVVLYLEIYGDLPDNYITKDEASALGWQGGSVDRFLEGAVIGGDRFGNREGLLPEGDYTECDLDTLGRDSRGAKRLVFSDDGDYYYTEDHYESFDEVYVTEEMTVEWK